MRTLLLSDIHANAEALDAVLEDALSRRFEQVLFLGDAVGYGPDPAYALESLADLGAACVLGNHDAWLLEIAGGGNPASYGVVGEVLAWQLERLGSAHLEELRRWPERLEVGPDEGRPRGYTAVHGSPRSTFEYVDTVPRARAVFAAWPGWLAFVGHTHLPGVYATLEGPAGLWVRHQAVREGRARLPMPPRARWIANPGSVGQPRDGDPRASYGVFDEERAVLEVYRVAYDRPATQAKLRAAGLPEPLAARLGVGR